MSYEFEENQNEITLEGDWSPEVIEIIKDSSISRLNLDRITWQDYTALEPIAPMITSLFFLYPLTVSSKGLDKFINIEYLYLDEKITPDFDISCFQALEEAKLNWSNKYSLDFFSLPKLRTLQLRYFDENNCENIGQSKSIEYLTIYQSKLKNLNGLDNISHLKELDIAHARGLEDISALKNLSLKKLSIDTSPKLLDLSPIKTLIHLEYIFIGKLKVGFDNLDWIIKLKDLKSFLNDSEVEVLNWEVIFENKALKKIITKTHEGYRITDDELHALAKEADRVITSIDRFPTKKNPTISLMLQ